MRYFNEQLTNDAALHLYRRTLLQIISIVIGSARHLPKYRLAEYHLQELCTPFASRPCVYYGTGKIKTKASLGYSKAGAFYDNYNYERYLFRVNNDLQINNRLSANLDVAYKRTNKKSTIGSPINEPGNASYL